MSGKMKWDDEGQRTTIRRGGGERTATSASMRNDPIQAAGAEIVLPDKYGPPACENELCKLRVELIRLLKIRLGDDV